MKKYLPYILLCIAAAMMGSAACHHKTQLPAVADTSAFPDSIASIMVNNCAVSGCHNQASYMNAAQLLLTSWSSLFAGSAYGAEVVAYSPKFSPLLYYVNAYDSTDPIANDPGHMPKPITLQQYHTLKNWITNGAPDKNGNIPFATNPSTRQKIYLTMNSACNQLAVIDGATKLVMRYIPVGDGNDYAEHDVAITGDGMWAYISLYSGAYVQKISTITDTVTATTNLSNDAVGGTGNWSIVNLSPMDTALMVSGWISPGYAVSISTSTMTVNEKMSVDKNTTSDISNFEYPHGLGNNAAWDTFFVTLQYGNVINKFWFNPFNYIQIPIKGSGIEIGTSATSPDPHQIQMSPDYSKLYVTCENSNEVRVIDAHSDAVLDSIPVGTFPQEMALDPVTGYLFVVCMRDQTNPLYASDGCIGSVYVINTANDQVVTKMYGFLNQPHDIAIDHTDGLLYVCSTNQGGVAHHISTCGGANGWYTVYNLNTLTAADNKVYEVLAYPYALANRF